MQFQYQDDGQKGEFFSYDATGKSIAEIGYIWRDKHLIVAHHTWVDHSLRGRGIARQLLEVLVEFAREKQLKIIPTCSYVEQMFRRDPRLADVAA